MKRSIPQRGLAILLAIFVTISFSVVLTGTTHAASKKTYYLATKMIVDGKTDTTCTYDKHGLLKTRKDVSSPKANYVRDKKGYLTKKTYSGNKSVAKITKRNKNGLPLVEKVYDENGKLSYTSTYGYFKNKIANSVKIVMSDGCTIVAKFDKYQNAEYYVEKEKDGKVSYRVTQNNTLYKKGPLKGHIQKAVVTEYSNYTEGAKATTEKYTITYTYKTKHGKVTQMTGVKKSSDNKTEKSVAKITYKKVKVPKKYQKLLTEPDCPYLNLY